WTPRRRRWRFSRARWPSSACRRRGPIRCAWKGTPRRRSSRACTRRWRARMRRSRTGCSLLSTTCCRGASRSACSVRRTRRPSGLATWLSSSSWHTRCHTRNPNAAWPSTSTSRASCSTWNRPFSRSAGELSGMRAGLRGASGVADARVAALELVDDRRGELVQVLRFAAGDPVPVLDHRLVLDGRAHLLQVVLDRLPGGQGAALDQVGGHQQLRPVADCGDQLSWLIELFDEVDHTLIDAEVVRRLAPRDEQGVIVGRLHLIDRLVSLHLLLPLVAFELLPGLHADHVDLVTRFPEPIVRDAELGILEPLSQNASDLHRRLHSGAPLNGVPRRQPAWKMRAVARARNPSSRTGKVRPAP